MDNIPDPQHPVEAVTHVDPYPYYRALAVERPLYFDDALRMWVAASAAAVTAALTHRACRVRPPAEPVPEALAGSAAGEIFGRLVRMVDAPAHGGRKDTILAALGGIDTAEFEAMCARRSAALPAADPMSLAFLLPAMVMAETIGVREDRLDEVAGWAGEFVRGISPLAREDQVARGGEAAERLREVVSGGDSPVLARLRADIPDAAVENAVGFLSQVYEATAGLIGNALVTLARRPALVDEVADHSDLLPALIEEVARFDPSVHNTRRWLAADAVVAGQAMQAGDAILVVLAAANHDPQANASPEVFDPHRSSRTMFTFGVGPHACPGQRLAVSIASAGVRRALNAGINLAGLLDGLTYQKSGNVRIPVFGGRHSG